jgi:Na+/melibiose symporter-like transporter
VGAALFAAAASLPFVIDSFSFLAASLLVFTLTGTYRARRRPRTKRARRQQRHVGPTIREDLREGWTWLKRNPLLRSLVAVGCTYNFLVVGAEALNVLFVRDVLHASKAVFGLVLTVSALGGIGAGLAAEHVIKKLGSGTTIITTLALAGVAGLAAGTTNNVIVFALAMALAIACGTTANIVVLSLRQTLVPDALRGRVNSIYRVSIATAAPLGALVAGQLAGIVSLRTPLLVMGFGSLILAVAAVPVVNNAAIARARNT